MQTNLEKPKHKHNKKRNTAFLFESLVKELTKSVLYQNQERQKVISNLIKEHFKKNSILDRELKLYKQIYETKQFPTNSAEKLIDQVKEEHKELNETEIFNEQSKLIAKINRMLGSEIYNNFVPNYKNIATISQIFNDNTPIKDKILLEQTVVNNLSKKEQICEMKPVDNILYKTFAGKFNEKYSGLLSEQKHLLSKFVSSFADDGLELKIFLNEEIERLKENVSTALKLDEISKDEQMKTKAEQVQTFLKTFKDAKEISKDMLEKILKIQQFVHEVNK